MRLIQLNAWQGHVMHPLLKFIENEKPDILCSQEILSSGVDNTLFDNYRIHERLCEIFAYQFFAPTFSFNSLGEEVTHGNAIYSLFPIKNPQTISINGTYKSSQTIANYTGNIRNLQLCQITVLGNDLTVANHHGFHDLNPAGTDESIQAVKKVVQSLDVKPAPFIFSGDLNVNPSSTALKELNKLELRNLSVEKSLETTLSPLTRVTQPVVCDYIFVNDFIKVQDFYASDELVSDHKALILEFDI